MSYDNNLTGVIFTERNKKSEKHPDHKGFCEINGVRYWVSAWNRQTKRGDAISLVFTVAETAEAAYEAASAESAAPAFDDEIPF